MTEQRVTCPNCGTRPEEFDEKQGGHRFAYFAKSEPCPGCKLLFDASEADKENAKKDKKDNPHRPWMKFFLQSRFEVRAEQARRRYWGGYEGEKDDPRKKQRKRKDGSSEGKDE